MTGTMLESLKNLILCYMQNCIIGGMIIVSCLVMEAIANCLQKKKQLEVTLLNHVILIPYFSFCIH